MQYLHCKYFFFSSQAFHSGIAVPTTLLRAVLLKFNIFSPRFYGLLCIFHLTSFLQPPRLSNLPFLCFPPHISCTPIKRGVEEMRAGSVRSFVCYAIAQFHFIRPPNPAMPMETLVVATTVDDPAAVTYYFY